MTPRLILALFALAGLSLAPQDAQEPGQDDPLLPPPIDFTEGDRFFAIADYNGNGWIAYGEAREALELDQLRFFAYDADRDGRIDLDEFRKVYAETIRLAGAFPPPLSDPSREQSLEPEGPYAGIGQPELPLLPAASVEELFGRVEERDDALEAQPRPPRIVGPVPMFRRLDFDDDGLISVEDLSDLGRPLAVPVRVPALVAILDKDKDGGISREEFYRSMQSKRPKPR